MSDSKSKGWGKRVKEERTRQATNEKIKALPPDTNDAFKFKSVKQPRAGGDAGASTQPTGAACGAASGTQSPAPAATAAPGATAAAAASTSATGTRKARTTSVSQEPTAVCVHACLIQLFKHSGLTESKNIGHKGAAILQSTVEEGAFSLLFYSPVTKAHEFAVELLTSFELTVQPVGTAPLPNGGGEEPTYFATFSDPVSKVFYSIKFTTASDLQGFARAITCVKDNMYTAAYKQGGARKMVIQDLVIGAGDSQPCEVGDMVSVKYELYLPADSHTAVGTKLGSGDLKKFVIGNTNASAGLEEVLSYQGIVGMRKKGRRFLVIPPDLTSASVWGPHVPAGSTLIVEVVLTSNKGRRIDIGAASKASSGSSSKAAHSVQPAPPISATPAVLQKEASERQASILPNLSGVAVGKVATAQAAAANDKKRTKSDAKSKGRTLSDATIDPDSPAPEDGDDDGGRDDARRESDGERDGSGDENDLPAGPLAASGGSSTTTAATVAAAATSAAARLQAAAAVHRDEEDDEDEDGNDDESDTRSSSSKPAAKQPTAAAAAKKPTAAPIAAAKKKPGDEDAPTAKPTTKKAAPAATPAVGGSKKAAAASPSAAVAAAGGETNDATAAAAPPLGRQESLKERMARVAHAARGPGAPPIIAPGRRASLDGATDEPAAADDELEIVKLLTDCNLLTYLPEFEKEHVSLQDLLSFDDAELKQLIPQLGPRKRLVTKLNEIKANPPPARNAAGPGAAAAAAAAARKAEAAAAASKPAPAAAATAKPATKPTTAAAAAGGSTDSKYGPTPTPTAAATTPAAASRGSVTAPGSGGKPTAAAAAPALPAAGGFKKVNNFLAKDAASTPPAAAAAAKPALPPTPTATAAPATATGGVYTAADIAREYERGKTETVELAREKINALRESGRSQIDDLTRQLNVAQLQLAAFQKEAQEQMAKAKTLVAGLRDETANQKSELAKERDEKETLLAKSRAYVEQNRKSRREENVKIVKLVVDKAFAKVSAEVKGNELYDGSSVLTLVKRTLVAVTGAFIKAPTAEEFASY